MTLFKTVLPTAPQREALDGLVRSFGRELVAEALGVSTQGVARVLEGRPVVPGSPLLSVGSRTWALCTVVADHKGLVTRSAPRTAEPTGGLLGPDPSVVMSDDRFSDWRRIRDEWARHEAGKCGPGCPLRGGR